MRLNSSKTQNRPSPCHLIPLSFCGSLKDGVTEEFNSYCMYRTSAESRLVALWKESRIGGFGLKPLQPTFSPDGIVATPVFSKLATYIFSFEHIGISTKLKYLTFCDPERSRSLTKYLANGTDHRWRTP